MTAPLEFGHLKRTFCAINEQNRSVAEGQTLRHRGAVRGDYPGVRVFCVPLVLRRTKNRTPAGGARSPRHPFRALIPELSKYSRSTQKTRTLANFPAPLRGAKCPNSSARSERRTNLCRGG